MNRNEIEAVSAALALEQQTVAALRARIDDLEHQLVAYDAALDGNLDLAEQVSPGTFFTRKHAAGRLPVAALRQAFPFPAEARENAVILTTATTAALANAGPTDADYLQWLWSIAQPKTVFLSCALPAGGGYRPRLDLAANGQMMPDPVSGQPLLREHSSLPRTGQHGLPRDWTWLITAWRLEVRGAVGWDCSQLEGILTFNYNQKRIATRPLSDALVPRSDDLLVTMHECLGFEFEVEFRHGVTRVEATPESPPPRLYVFLDVIAHETVV